MAIIDCLILTAALSYIIDVSGVMAKLNATAFRLLYGKQKNPNGWSVPVMGCSVCASWWVCLIYGLFHLSFIHAVGVAALCSFIAPVLSYLMRNIYSNILK